MLTRLNTVFQYFWMWVLGVSLTIAVFGIAAGGDLGAPVYIVLFLIGLNHMIHSTVDVLRNGQSARLYHHFRLSLIAIVWCIGMCYAIPECSSPVFLLIPFGPCLALAVYFWRITLRKD